ncbi:MAG: excinuclease ABC subunit UvrC [Helicobacteraceae bacterium]|jgi:excinuclease ABC subunit C|nr:excinuclease ABC subunit UvrC [Helicobacteraceae bacterium]
MKSLEDSVKNLPQSSGVYQYFDKNGRLLYVGKAKNLKNRVRQYFVVSGAIAPDPRLSARIAKMISETSSLEYIIVENESDALILENSLIKQLKPKYNILLRDDKTYPYIYVDLSADFPRFEITRKVIATKSVKYFGPFTSSARYIYDALYSLFPFTQKRGCLKEKKACLFYQIGKCSAPCEGRVEKSAYRAMIDEATALINNKEKMAKALEKKMNDFAQNEHFEEAAKIRDQIRGILSSAVQSGVDLARKENFDVLALADLGNSAVASRLFIREGRVVSSAAQSFRFSQGYDEDEAYKRSFLSFYTSDTPIAANVIYVAKTFAEIEEIKEWLNKLYQKKIDIIVAKIGAKKALVDLALKNAQETLRKEAQSSSIDTAIKELLKFENTPKRLEIFDNSHIMGEATVGAMVVFDNGEWVKSDYRSYNLTAKNEYDQMLEILSRRAEKFNENPPPDCWVIDGGETLRRLAIDVLSSAGVKIDVAAIGKEKLDGKAHRAKGAAKDILYANGEVFRLDPSDKRLQFFQKLRDEAHRFAIAFHRRQKRKEDNKLKILKVKGIGDATLKRLISVFGTFEAIEKANYDEIAQAAGQKAAKALKGSVDQETNSEEARI